MNRTTAFFIALLCAAPAAALTVSHDLRAVIEPGDGSLRAEDNLTFPAPAAEFVFTLHRGLSPASPDGELVELAGAEAEKHGINGSAAGLYSAYRLSLPAPKSSFRLSYSGVIAHPPGEQAQEYARSFSETPGIISSSGCYLSGVSGWYPVFDGALVSYRLETSLPAPYDSVSGGDRVHRSSRGGRAVTRWSAQSPQDDITLACGRYTEYSRRDKDLRLDYQAFLLSPDPALAARYLEATGKYMKLYSDLVGPYPYGKFALVENFWDTGYGLPSFTLLGNKVIRLPFIISSSYPHEILHNWWGNGVFVDYAAGNWCEGLTAYLADYLIAEHRGKGRDYRMTSLQKYSDYVSGGADFPLTEFRSRHSSASEAVGYGKMLMVYHMLRGLLGEEGFRRGLRRFYADNKFRTASFSDLRAAFETVSGPGRLAPFFEQWTRRAGAPDLRLKNVRAGTGPLGHELEFTLEQAQEGPPYELDVPAAIALQGAPEPRLTMLKMRKKEESYHYSSLQRPARLMIDPEFDLFRRVSPLETPPTLSRLLGASRPALLLPAGDAGAPWRALAAAWTKDKANLPLVSDDTAAVFPSSSSFWVLGAENRLAPALLGLAAANGAAVTNAEVVLENRRFPRAGHTFVFASFHPSDPALSAALVLSGNPEKAALLAAKLPHYGKYSWLVFDENMTSLASGVWPLRGSPLAAELLPGSPLPAFPVRRPLAAPPSAFSADRMRRDAAHLAGLKGGRAPSSPGHAAAARYVEAEFRKAGLKPFAAARSGAGPRNLLWLAPGSSGKEEYIALSAHYDHLPQKDGRAYPGADDNASGVAVLLELARHYGRNPLPRGVLFAAFDGEEDGRAGSRAFLAALPPDRKARFNAAINFDTVGRLGAGKILALGSSSSDKWVHILRGAGFVTGYDYAAAGDLDSSDQVSFIEAGIPALQLFSGPNQDYHKPSDTADKLDPAGMARIAEFAREMADYLGGDSDFITRPAGAPAGTPKPAGERRASTGLVPDFSFSGPGVRAQEVAPGSPLALAGFAAGDVVTALEGIPTPDLRTYSAELKKYAPGRKVRVSWLSGGSERSAEIELAAR